MASDPGVPKAMEWQQEEGDELCPTTAQSVETTHIQLVKSASADQTPWSPEPPLGFLAKQGR